MRKAGAMAAALLACAFVSSALPARATEAMQQRGTLPRGGAYVIDADPSVGVAAISLWFRAPGAGYDNGSPGISRLAATAAATAALPGGSSLVSLVRSVGGALNISAYPDMVGVGAVVPASAARRVVAAMTAAYFAPVIDDSAVRAARSDSAVLSVEQRYSADAVLHDLLFERIFAAGPAHFATVPETVAQLSRIAPPDVAAFARRAFRSANALLALTGNVDGSSIAAVTSGSGSSEMDAPFDSSLSGFSGETTASGAVRGIGLAWVGPPITDEKSATALDFVSDYLFRDETGEVARALDAGNVDASASGQFITLHDPGVLLVTIAGTDSRPAAQQVLARLSALQRPLDPITFAAAREAFLYHIAVDTETVEGQADNLGWYAAEGAPEYAPGDQRGRYERVARELDPQYVAAVVTRYLTRQPTTVNLIAVPGSKGSTS